MNRGTTARSTTAGMTDQILQDFFNDENIKIAYNKKRSRHRHVVLQSMNDTIGSSNSGLRISQSTSNIGNVHIPTVHGHVQTSSILKSTIKQDSNSSNQSSPSKQPLHVADIHRVSDLMHRIADVSGSSPMKDNRQQHPLDTSSQQSNTDISRNIKEVQLQTMKDSQSLKGIMNRVVECHDQLQAVVADHLHYRVEVGAQVQEINRAYIELFEQMMHQVLLQQRTKFKTQTATIEDLQAEIALLNNKIASDTEHIARLRAENRQLALQVDDIEVLLSGAKNDVTRLEAKLAEYEDRVDSAKDADRESKAHLKRTVNEMKLAHAALVENTRLQYMRELKAVQTKLDTALADSKEQQERLQEYEAKTQLFQRDTNEIVFKCPSRDSSTQTEVDTQGLWDKTDGWVLPISKTANARNRWRRALRFTHCPSCRGIGKYTASVLSLYHAVRRGPDPVPSTHTMTDVHSKWRLPDTMVQFLSNLPKSVQALSPKTMLWVVRIVTHLFNHKYRTDAEDARLGYNCQPFIEYIVEMFLLRLETRSDAEIGIYRVLTTLREHYRKHPMLMVFARFLGIVDVPSVEEIEVFTREQLAKEAAMKRKKDSEIVELRPRLRTKVLQHIKAEKEIQRAKQSHGTSQFEMHIARNFKALDLDILSVYLYARHCILKNNYSGVYAKRIKKIKAQSLWLAITQNSLMGGVRNPDSSVLDHIHEASSTGDTSSSSNNNGLSATAAREHIYDVPLADIPDHLCIGDRCTNWVPLDRAVRVIRVFIGFLSPPEVMAVYHSLENHAVFLLPDGRLDLPEGMHTLIRRTTRLFCYSKSDEGADLNWFAVYGTYQNTSLDGEHDSDMEHQAGDEDEMKTQNSTHNNQNNSVRGGGEQSPSKRGGNNNNSSKHPSVASARKTAGGDSSAANTGVSRSSNKPHTLDGASMFSANTHSGQRASNRRESTIANTTNTTIKPQRLVEVRGGVVNLDQDCAATARYYDGLHPDTIMVDLDHVLQLIVDTMLLRCADVERHLTAIFTEGDVNKDGVLSFGEFTDIATRVAPGFSQRKILKMFREALRYGEDSDFIGPEAFLSVCKAYGLIKLVDLNELKATKLKALSDPPLPQSLTVDTTAEPPAAGGGINTRREQPQKQQALQQQQGLNMPRRHSNAAPSSSSHLSPSVNRSTHNSPQHLHQSPTAAAHRHTIHYASPQRARAQDLSPHKHVAQNTASSSPYSSVTAEQDFSGLADDQQPNGNFNDSMRSGTDSLIQSTQATAGVFVACGQPQDVTMEQQVTAPGSPNPEMIQSGGAPLPLTVRGVHLGHLHGSSDTYSTATGQLPPRKAPLILSSAATTATVTATTDSLEGNAASLSTDFIPSVPSDDFGDPVVLHDNAEDEDDSNVGIIARMQAHRDKQRRKNNQAPPVPTVNLSLQPTAATTATVPAASAVSGGADHPVKLAQAAAGNIHFNDSFADTSECSSTAHPSPRHEGRHIEESSVAGYSDRANVAPRASRQQPPQPGSTKLTKAQQAALSSASSAILATMTADDAHDFGQLSANSSVYKDLSPSRVIGVSIGSKARYSQEEEWRREAALQTQRLLAEQAAAEVAAQERAIALKARAAAVVPPQDIARQLQVQHETALRGVDTKALQVNSAVSKSSAESIMTQLKMRREMRK